MIPEQKEGKYIAYAIILFLSSFVGLPILGGIFEKTPEQILMIAGGLMILVVGLFLCGVKKPKFNIQWPGENRPVDSPLVVQYDLPPGVTPAEAGLLADNEVHTRDITAEIINLAVHKYLIIKRIVTPEGRSDYEFIKLKEEDALLSAVQKMLLYGLFQPATDGKVRLSLFRDVYSVSKSLFVEAVHDSVIQKGLTKNVHGSLTSKGNEAVRHIQGLLLYLSVAEKDRLAFHNGKDKLEIFEELLPAAIALGYEDAWKTSWSKLYIGYPSWCEDYKAAPMAFMDTVKEFEQESSEVFGK